jgi:hypothetical protein
MPPNSNILPECLGLNPCKRDRCYFGNAIIKHNQGLCGEINSPMLRASCMNKVVYNKTMNNATIEGQVFNTKNCGFYANLSVELRDEIENKTIALTTTNGTGEYGFNVPAGKDYGIYVTIKGLIGDFIFNQNQSNVSNRIYVVDFAMS